VNEFFIIIEVGKRGEVRKTWNFSFLYFFLWLLIGKTWEILRKSKFENILVKLDDFNDLRGSLENGKNVGFEFIYLDWHQGWGGCVESISQINHLKIWTCFVKLLKTILSVIDSLIYNTPISWIFWWGLKMGSPHIIKHFQSHQHFSLMSSILTSKKKAISIQ